MKYKQYQFDSFRLLTIQSDAFKNCYMEVNFLDDATEIFMPLRCLLVQLMGYSTKKYSTKRELLIALEELYNSSFSSTVYRIGKTFISNFSFDFLDPKFVSDDSYLEQCISFFCEALLNPDTNEEEFRSRSIQIIKERIHSNIDRYKETALDYALHEARHFLFQDSLSGKDIVGTHEEIDAITAKDLFLEYQNMFQNSSVDILVIGNLDMDQVASLFQKYFQKKSIVEREYSYYVDNPILPFQEFEENGKYVQTQLLMYLQFPTLTVFERCAVARVYSQILGNANQTDKLARYLRIETPLAYSRSAGFNFPNQYLLLTTGLKYENVSVAKEAMMKALNEMVNGDIDRDYFELQKEKILSNISMQEDSMYYLLDNYYFHVLYGQYLLDELKEKIKEVQIEDIQNLAKKLFMSMIYVLKEVQE